MDSSALGIMVPAFVECLVLVGIHSYLGLHVIKRKVIFVDLALAQIAALGATVGFLFGMAPGSTASFLFSMIFTFLGAAVFALTRVRHDRVPQEAVIGLVYALAAAVTILVVDKSPHGAEHIKDLLTGTILWVKWSEIITAAVAYSCVGVFHYWLRKKLILISEDPDKAARMGMWIRLWDFLFYLSFGFVISFSVRTAGVLLVFVFLVAPAIIAALITKRWRAQLIIGWSMGTAVTLVALYASYIMDLPSGPTVVAFYGAVLLVTALVLFVTKSQAKSRAAKQLVWGIGATTLVVAAVWGVGSALGASSLARDPKHEQLAANQAADKKKLVEAVGKSNEIKVNEDDPVIEDDPEKTIAQIKARVERKDEGWRQELVKVIIDPELPLLFKEDALKILRKQAGEDFGYDSEKEDNASAVERMKAWAGQSTPTK